MYNLKYEHQNKGENHDHGESYYKNENEKSTKKNDHLHVIKLENSYNKKDDTSHDDAIKNDYEDFNYDLKNDICNRENQWYFFILQYIKLVLRNNTEYNLLHCSYMFTSSFKEGAEPIVLTPPEEPLNMVRLL